MREDNYDNCIKNHNAVIATGIVPDVIEYNVGEEGIEHYFSYDFIGVEQASGS